MEKLCFRAESTENLTKLLCRILFEKSPDYKEYNWLWHEVFDKDSDKGDELMYQFMCEAQPEGGAIDPELILKTVMKHLKEDDEYKDLQNNHLKKTRGSWVYSAWNKKLVLCDYLAYTQTVIDLCIEYFKGMEDIDISDVSKFILNNIEIKSDYTLIYKIAKDHVTLRMICRESRGY